MSKVAIQGNASGTGVFTLAAPNSNTDRTLTLPDAAGTMMLTDTGVTTAQMPAGSVIQVVQVSTATAQSTNSTSYVDATGLSLNITPSSVSNKILVMAHIEAAIGVSGLNTHGRYRVLRNSAIDVGFQSLRNYDYGNSGVYSAAAVAITVLDSPNTTSPVNYKVQFQKITGDYMYVSGENGWSTLTVMEIAA